MTTTAKLCPAAADPAAAVRAARRILVLGCPGAGKSTLARHLASAVGRPVYHLDDEYWGPDWTRPSPSEWERRQARLAARDVWIIDGNYLATIPVRAVRADLVLLVHAPAARCLLRVITRAWRIRHGRYEELPAAVREQALAGARVRATRDFLALVRLILRFRHDWPQVLAAASTNPATVLLVVTDRGPSAGRAAGGARRAGTGVPAPPVVALSAFEPLIPPWPRRRAGGAARTGRHREGSV